MFSTEAPSSSDSESEVFGKSLEISTHSTKTGLAGLFSADTPVPTPSDTEKSASPEPTREERPPPTHPITVLSTVVHSFLEEDGNYVSKGKVGLALVLTNNQLCFLLYTPDKKPLVKYGISKGFPFSVNSSYVYFACGQHRWSISFLDNEIDKKKDLLCWFLLFSEVSDDFLIVRNEGFEVSNGDSIMMNIETIRVGDGSLETTLQEGFKLKIRQKTSDNGALMERCRGMRKGDMKMYYDSTSKEVKVFTVRKVKFADNQKNVKEKENSKERESSSETTSLKIEQLSSEVTSVNEITKEFELENFQSHSDCSVLERIARIGQPMLPVVKPISVITEEPTTIARNEQNSEEIHLGHVSTPNEEQSEKESKVVATEVATNEVAEVSSVNCPASSSPIDYESFHRCVGIEMDRLQIRLEAFFQRTIDERVQRIEDKISSIEANQLKILDILQNKRKEQ